jgi:hypothetical protein
MRLGCALRRLIGFMLLVAGIGIILLLNEILMPETGSGEPIDTTIEAVLAGEGPVNEMVRVRGQLRLFKWTTDYEERGGQKHFLGTVYDYSLSTVKEGEIIILPVRSEETLSEGSDVEVVGQLLHRAYGKTYVVNVESEPSITMRWLFIGAGAMLSLAGVVFLLRRG